MVPRQLPTTETPEVLQPDEPQPKRTKQHHLHVKYRSLCPSGPMKTLVGVVLTTTSLHDTDTLFFIIVPPPPQTG